RPPSSTRYRRLDRVRGRGLASPRDHRRRLCMAKTVDEQELRQLIGVGATPSGAPSPHAVNARYLSSLDGFNIKRPPVPAAGCVAERARPLAPRPPPGLVALAPAGRLGLPYPATTPLVLARYARIRSGERLGTELQASTELYYALRGSGRTRFGPGGRETIDWTPGDVFCLPGGGAVEHTAGPDDAVLWVAAHERPLA